MVCGPSPALDPAAFRARDQLPGLDGLRALAILLVLLHHAPRLPVGSWLATLQENGRQGVALFFVISGFLIATLLLRERDVNGGIALGRFYARRALRLLPLYYLVLAGECVLVFALHEYSPENRALFAQKLPAYLLYFSNWLPTATRGPFFVAWSLAVEEQFYLLFAASLALLGRRASALAPICVALLAAKAVAVARWPDAIAASGALRALTSYQEAILIGVLLAFAAHARVGYALVAAIGAWWPVAAIGALAALATHPFPGRSGADALALDAALAVLVAGVATRPPTRALDHRALVHVGRTSYAIYLLHMPLMDLAKRVLHERTWPCLAVAAAASIVVASVSWRWFEQPIVAYAKRRFGAPRPRTDPAAPPVAATAATAATAA